MTASDYACPECDGHGETECECCKAEQDCEACEGTGCDPDLIDVGAWDKAMGEFCREHDGCWGWRSADDRVLGYTAADGSTLALADYAVGAVRSPQGRLPGL